MIDLNRADIATILLVIAWLVTSRVPWWACLIPYAIYLILKLAVGGLIKLLVRNGYEEDEDGKWRKKN